MKNGKSTAIIFMGDFCWLQHLLLDKSVARIIAVALPRLQYRVANPQCQPTNTILPTRTAKKWLPPLFGFGLSHAP